MGRLGVYLEAIDKEIDVQMPHDNKNSGQTLSQLLAERDNPVADVAYYGVTTGIKAGNEGVAAAYKPTGFDDIPDGLKDRIANGLQYTMELSVSL